MKANEIQNVFIYYSKIMHLERENMKSGIERKMIKNLKSGKTIIIFGAGGVGQKVCAWIKNNKFTNIYYAVSDKSRNPEQIDGIVVKQIEEMTAIKESSVVIVATQPVLHQEIKQCLNKLGFKNTFFVNDRFLKSIGIVEVNGVFPEKRAIYYKKINQVARMICSLFSCKNIVVFESKIDYTDNCRALSEYMEKYMADKYQIVWIMKKPEKHRGDLKDKKIYINRYHMSTVDIIRLNYYISRAKFIFFTHPGWLHEWTPEQKVINLGHGNPLKKAEPLGHVADCVLASGKDGVKYRKLEYKDEMRVEILGPPRNDWLFVRNSSVMQKYTEGNVYQKIIICLPTYKQYETDAGILKKTKYDSRELNEFCLNTIQDNAEFMKFNQFLKEKQVLLLCKEHYLQKKTKKKNMTNIKYIDNDLLQKNDHDIYHLLANADALITDFSSIYMDYLLLDKPIGFFCNSFNEYVRGFTLEQPEKYMPGMKIYDNDGLKSFVVSVINNYDKYKKERKEVRDLIFKYQDNQNCKRCAEHFEL